MTATSSSLMKIDPTERLGARPLAAPPASDAVDKVGTPANDTHEARIQQTRRRSGRLKESRAQDRLDDGCSSEPTTMSSLQKRLPGVRKFKFTGGNNDRLKAIS